MERSPRLDRSVVLVGLMGAGKSSVGRRLAQRLHVSFVDADAEIERAAGCSIEDIFARYGEQAFRDGERRVIARLLEGPVQVLATGGGAFLDPETRRRIKEGAVSVWLKADLEVLVRRTSGRLDRPLLKAGNPRQVLARLIEERYPVYAEADITIESVDESPEVTTSRVLAALARRVDGSGSDLAGGAPEAAGRVRVELGPRGYDILVGPGLIAQAGHLLAPLVREKRVFVVTDETVARLHLQRLEGALAEAGLSPVASVVPAGEASKSFAVLERVLDDLLARRIERGSTVLAFGGGVVGDLAGFAAATVLRGVDCVQLPTTLLAQVDSSVGGKTGINTPRGKNLVGAFHQPRLVIADTEVLDTLPRRELVAGYAELVKYGLLGDAAFFAWLEANAERALAGDQAARRHAVRASCAAKAALVAEDEREDGRRALLNLGHTFAHALEAEFAYRPELLHGEAVAIGMALAFELSARLGHCPAEDAARVRAHLRRVGLPVDLSAIAGAPPIEPGRLIGHMRVDKKVRAGALAFVLVRGIGRAFVSREVPEGALHDLLGAALGAA
ncbi:MAG: 3-dehydroquinate synthase [Proteobacteria bacterium]|nr:3-dehydroquinate synthase [Pseudomonadota bacterium]